ncbi:MAG: hypothetical protein PUP91_21545 [Rhizonema sp. PD37]|nr:hypothetical protein [Rhizonema sp. PD37]
MILEDDLDSNQLALRCPQPKKQGRGGDVENKLGAGEQRLIRVSVAFKQIIIAIPKCLYLTPEKLNLPNNNLSNLF